MNRTALALLLLGTLALVPIVAPAAGSSDGPFDFKRGKIDGSWAEAVTMDSGGSMGAAGVHVFVEDDGGFGVVDGGVLTSSGGDQTFAEFYDGALYVLSLAPLPGESHGTTTHYAVARFHYADHRLVKTGPVTIPIPTGAGTSVSAFEARLKPVVLAAFRGR